jgi:hypothetical protein
MRTVSIKPLQSVATQNKILKRITAIEHIEHIVIFFFFFFLFFLVLFSYATLPSLPKATTQLLQIAAQAPDNDNINSNNHKLVRRLIDAGAF